MVRNDDQISIRLTEENRRLVDAALEGADTKDAEAFVNRFLNHHLAGFDAQYGKSVEEIDAMIEEGLKGPFYDHDDGFWESFRAERARLREERES